MTEDEARELIRALQSALDARDLDALTALFHEDAVLIGTSAHSLDRAAVVAYLAAVVDGDPFRWELNEFVPHDTGFAAFGEIVAGEFRAPFRLTIVADAGRIRSFHGSFPSAG